MIQASTDFGNNGQYDQGGNGMTDKGSDDQDQEAEYRQDLEHWESRYPMFNPLSDGVQQSRAFHRLSQSDTTHRQHDHIP